MPADSRCESTVRTEMFTRQTLQNLKSATVQKYWHPKKVGHSDGRLGKQVTTFSRHTNTLVDKFGKFPIQKSEEFEVGNGKNYQRPQNPQYV